MQSQTLLAFEDRLLKRLNDPLVISVLGGIGLSLFFLYHYFHPDRTASEDEDGEETAPQTEKSIMSPPVHDLLPPKSDPYTLEDLKRYDGSDPSLPLLVSIKGPAHPRHNIFNV
jgi:hypothetical protein